MRIILFATIAILTKFLAFVLLIATVWQVTDVVKHQWQPQTSFLDKSWQVIQLAITILPLA
ncbi:hypothetical protein [Lacticaseibacillus saniviri]|uniref:Uncharacterized protein n=1 Tax=Lacticaseibacillus saniviri JCM 17471 = DSM 24301 TaxID=1293598 RepID=A0A0R2MUE1_9LACO|nr:hypothetical protein [Lacticaseibacillus saniviri]KRO15920.1 hypothetical protein IV56_GL002111 [Lacticaseibacillus saniviri JCM 17471 = DSM 24301]MCG4282456.1 hypothetical protein [Lacticaseibacillus saniviri]